MSARPRGSVRGRPDHGRGRDRTLPRAHLRGCRLRAQVVSERHEQNVLDDFGDLSDALERRDDTGRVTFAHFLEGTHAFSV